MPCVHRFAAVFATLLLVTPIAAQGATQRVELREAITAPVTARATEPTAAADRASSLAPTSQNASVGIRTTVVQPVPSPAPMPRRGDSSRNRALMIVGGVALLVGAVVATSNSTAGAIIMIGGGIVGIYGLYQYLQ